jgi:hypothetical protein
MERHMKILATTFSMLMALFIFISGCSDEDQPVFPTQKSSVRKPIKMPEQKKAETKTPVTETEPESVEEEIAGAKTTPVETMKLKEEEDIPEKEEKGFYLVKKGDTLSQIAGNVYGDPLKWPILYRVNSKLLDNLGSTVDAPETEITEGIKLKIIEPDEAQDVLKKSANNFWVVNVLSSPKMEKVVPNAIKLMKNGYPVYLTRIKVKGEDWMRVRTGFFDNREEADREGKKLIVLMNIEDIWTTKATEEEFEEFGGYM